MGEGMGVTGTRVRLAKFSQAAQSVEWRMYICIHADGQGQDEGHA